MWKGEAHCYKPYRQERPEVVYELIPRARLTAKAVGDVLQVAANSLQLREKPVPLGLHGRQQSSSAGTKRVN